MRGKLAVIYMFGLMPASNSGTLLFSGLPLMRPAVEHSSSYRRISRYQCVRRSGCFVGTHA